MLQETIINKQLKTKHLGRQLVLHDTLPSTNDLAKTISPTAAHGTTIAASEQTAGRGRRGRQFFSPALCGLYISVIIKQDLTPRALGLLTGAVAVAAAKGIEKVCPADVRIKWVNDLLINGKKVGGILCEKTQDGAVIGIGINLSTPAFPAELAEIASSLLLACGKAPDDNAVLAAVLNELEPLLNDLESAAFLRESRARSAVLGKTVTVLRGEERFSAKAIDIDENGYLVVQTDREIIALFSGEVSLRL